MNIIDTKYKIQSIRNLTESTYVIRFDRNAMDFKAGQNLNLGIKGDPEKRDYSIYSGENDDYLEILVKEVEEGLVSKQLKKLKPGDELEVEGPFGFFTLNESEIQPRNIYLSPAGQVLPRFTALQNHILSLIIN